MAATIINVEQSELVKDLNRLMMTKYKDWYCEGTQLPSGIVATCIFNNNGGTAIVSSDGRIFKREGISADLAKEIGILQGDIESLCKGNVNYQVLDAIRKKYKLNSVSNKEFWYYSVSLSNNPRLSENCEASGFIEAARKYAKVHGLTGKVVSLAKYTKPKQGWSICVCKMKKDDKLEVPYGQKYFEVV